VLLVVRRLERRKGAVVVRAARRRAEATPAAANGHRLWQLKASGGLTIQENVFHLDR